VTVPVVSRRIEVFVDGTIIVIFTDNHVPIPLIVGFHEIEALIVGGLQRRELGITSRQPEHGHNEPEREGPDSQ